MASSTRSTSWPRRWGSEERARRADARQLGLRLGARLGQLLAQLEEQLAVGLEGCVEVVEALDRRAQAVALLGQGVDRSLQVAVVSLERVVGQAQVLDERAQLIDAGGRGDRVGQAWFDFRGPGVHGQGRTRGDQHQAGQHRGGGESAEATSWVAPASASVEAPLRRCGFGLGIPDGAAHRVVRWLRFRARLHPLRRVRCRLGHGSVTMEASSCTPLSRGTPAATPAPPARTRPR